MVLDRSLLKEFAQITNDTQEDSKAKQYVRGTVTSGGDDRKYVTIDGSNMVTPISEVVDVEPGDRVLVSIENHKATIIGNFTFPPSARKEQEALDNSNTAISDSNTALEKAQSASDKADTAITESSVASALAGEAKSEASEAITVAQNASQNATEAKDKAEEANTKSSAAQTAANESKDAVSATNIELSKVKTEVANAKNDISSALSDLESQAGEIANIKETYSTKIETNKVKADLTTEITKKVGELQTTVSENYALKTDVVEMEGSLQTQITQNAENISSQASKVEKLEADTAAAQESVDKALADALAAQNAANAAQSTADAAQSAANTAKADAATAQTKADNAQAAADAAQAAVDIADKSLQQAKNDLAEAQQNLANVTSRVDATEQEIADAQTKVNEATTNVNKALEDVAEAQLAANNAQTAADKAQADANTAKTAANNAQTAADNAQTAADNAQTAADKAQADVAALTNRVTTAETKISQNAEAIELRATKTEVTKSVNDINTNLSNNYYNKTQADAAIKVASDNINLSVSKTYATITDNQKAQAAANKAQNIANTAVNNAKTAQDTADDAKAKAESAKTDLSALTTRVAEAESSISQNANRITATVTEVTTVKKSAVTSSVEQFYASTSPTGLSGGSWSTTQPTWSEGKYIWRRTLVTKGDGSTSYSPSEKGVCITGNTGATGARGPQGVKGDTGAQGPQGVKGDTGATGKGVSKIEVFYLTTSASSGVTTSTSGWSTTPTATTTKNKYIWSYQKTTYTDNSTSSSTPAIIGTHGATGAQGIQGLQGEKGDQGIQGPKGDTGANGQTSYFHIKYSSVAKPTSSSQMTETPSTYIGTYVDFTSADSDDPNKYTWSQFKGSQGAKGDQGIAGANGTNGKTSYLHIAYANSADGKTGFSVSDSANKLYIGQYTDFTPADSSDPTKYSWTKIKGETGDKGAKGDTGATGNGIKSIEYYYARTTSQTAPSASNVTSTSMPSLDATNKYLWQKEVITYTNGTTKTSVILLAVYGNTGAQGAKGDKGDTGPQGPQGVKGDTGATGKGVKSSAVTYQASTSGTTIPTGTWSTSIPSVAAGSYLWTRTIITYTDNSTTTSYSVGKMGNTGATGSQGPQGPQGVKGDTGAAGKGIKSTAITYQAWSNGTSTPTGTWSSSPPATSASKPYLWTRTIITYTDNSTSTSYSVGSTPEGIVVGGRNFIANSNFIAEATYSTFAPSKTVAIVSGIDLNETFLNKTVVFSYFVHNPGERINAQVSFGNRFGIHGIVSWINSSNGNTVDTYPFAEELESSHINKRVQMKSTFTPPSGYDKIHNFYFSYQPHAKPADEGVIWKIGKPKLEIGNKATDWTPAPEDVEEGYKNYADDAVSDATVTITESYESLIEETSKQINLMIQQLTEITNNQGTSISTISNQLQLTTEMAQFVKTTTEQLQGVVDGKVSAEEIHEWARFDGATLELGASNQPFKAKLSTTELAFYQGNNKVAWISNNELHILTAIITKSIGCGNFTFIDEGDLGFSLL